MSSSMADGQMANGDLTPAGHVIHEHYRGLMRTKRAYTLLALALLVGFLAGALWFANAANAGKFFDLSLIHI